MFKFFLLLILILESFITLVWCKLPNDIEQCPAGDKTCILNNINHIFQTKLNGDEEFGLIKLKPMIAGRLLIDEGITLEIKNMKLDGLDTVKAIKVKGFGPKPEGIHEVIFKADILSLLGNYKGEGKILIFSLSGQGKANLTMIEPVFKITINGKSLTKDDQIYLDVTSTRMELKKKKEFIIYYENLFHGDKFLNEQFNEIIKQDEELVDEFLPPVLDSIQHNIYLAIKKVFSKTPYNEIFKISE